MRRKIEFKKRVKREYTFDDDESSEDDEMDWDELQPWEEAFLEGYADAV